jgi:hypothetical protein
MNNISQPQLGQVMKMLTNYRFIIAFVFLTCILVVFNWNFISYGPMPERDDLDQIREVSKKIEGVLIKRIDDLSLGWDEARVYITLTTSTGGYVVLYNATLDTFTRGGPVYLERIGDCFVLPKRNLNSKEIRVEFPDLYVSSVPELIAKYDLIYNRLQDYAHHDDGVNRPGCWR